MNMYEQWKKEYGLTPMTFAEECDAPLPVRETRMQKVEIIDNCRLIIAQAQHIIKYAKRIPEDDDPAHAELVTDYANGIHSALIGLLETEQKRWM